MHIVEIGKSNSFCNSDEVSDLPSIGGFRNKLTCNPLKALPVLVPTNLLLSNEPQFPAATNNF